MRVTSQNDGDFVLFTQPQNLQIIGSCRRFVTDRIQGTVIDFQQCMMFFCSQDYRFEIQFGRPVTGMTDDVDVWIGNGLHHSVRILLHRAPVIAERMDTGNAQVQPLQIILIQIQISFSVQNIDFSSQQQFDTVHPAGNHMQIPEINGVTGPRNSRRMFRDTQHFQPFVGSSPGHFL